ncbi:lytic transglycosylase domain-containing protein, partial [Candidatus Poribacteria bacterium]|nr:lytic transglycosylase domain-containing protein [Candidatus Poribacteria bacterium]
PEQNIESGTRYLRGLIDRFGSTELALWAYNAGPTAVEEGRMPLETQEYVPRVLLMQNYFSREAR